MGLHETKVAESLDDSDVASGLVGHEFDHLVGDICIEVRKTLAAGILPLLGAEVPDEGILPGLQIYLLKTSPLNTTTLGIKIQHMNFGETQTFTL